MDAEVDEFSGSMLSTPKRLAFDVEKLRVQTRNAPGHADPHLGIEAHHPNRHARAKSVALAFSRARYALYSASSGSAASSAAARAICARQVLASTGSAPGAPVHQDASLHVEAHGHLPDLEGVAHATVGAGKVDIHVRASLDKTTTAHAVVDASQIDARAFSPTFASASTKRTATAPSSTPCCPICRASS